MVSSLKRRVNDMHTVVLIRHGESEWNKQNRFTGWHDVDLSEKGELEARHAGDLLSAHGYQFDCVYTSRLTRAIRTSHSMLCQLGLLWIPEYKQWELNERHYGSLQGCNKEEKAKEVGKEQVHIWRRSYDISPPPLSDSDDMHPRNDARYSDIDPKQLPSTESLKDTVARVVPFWDANIRPKVLSGARILIAAHGNSLRALMKHLKGISDADIMQLNIPTGQPLVVELDSSIGYMRDYYIDI